MIKIFTTLKILGIIMLVLAAKLCYSEIDHYRFLGFIIILLGMGLIAIDLARDMFLKPISEEESE